MKFPESFKFVGHIITGAKQWTLCDANGNILISIVGGPGMYGDGVNTFEMWDLREDDPRGYLTKDEINDYLTNHPF